MGGEPSKPAAPSQGGVRSAPHGSFGMGGATMRRTLTVWVLTMTLGAASACGGAAPPAASPATGGASDATMMAEAPAPVAAAPAPPPPPGEPSFASSTGTTPVSGQMLAANDVAAA